MRAIIGPIIWWYDSDLTYICLSHQEVRLKSFWPIPIQVSTVSERRFPTRLGSKKKSGRRFNMQCNAVPLNIVRGAFRLSSLYLKVTMASCSRKQVCNMSKEGFDLRSQNAPPFQSQIKCMKIAHREISSNERFYMLRSALRSTTPCWCDDRS